MATMLRATSTVSLYGSQNVPVTGKAIATAGLCLRQESFISGSATRCRIDTSK